MGLGCLRAEFREDVTEGLSGLQPARVERDLFAELVRELWAI